MVKYTRRISLALSVKYIQDNEPSESMIVVFESFHAAFSEIQCKLSLPAITLCYVDTEIHFLIFCILFLMES